jgi:hypothetical protein
MDLTAFAALSRIPLVGEIQYSCLLTPSVFPYHNRLSYLPPFLLLASHTAFHLSLFPPLRHACLFELGTPSSTVARSLNTNTYLHWSPAPSPTTTPPRTKDTPHTTDSLPFVTSESPSATSSNCSSPSAYARPIASHLRQTAINTIHYTQHETHIPLPLYGRICGRIYSGQQLGARRCCITSFAISRPRTQTYSHERRRIRRPRVSRNYA